MQSPILKTARLTLAFPFVHEGMDVGHYLKWLQDDVVMQYSEQRHKVHTSATQYEYLSSFPYAGDRLFWQIDKNSKPIGSISAFLDKNNKIANIGIMIGERREWNNGYASEAWSAVCNFLFEDGYRKLEAGCMTSNRAMVSLLFKTGFSNEAIIPGHFLKNGKPEDLLLYGKFRTAKVISIKKNQED